DRSLNLGQVLAADAAQGRVVAEFFIATVPDPVDSRFGYRFDSVLDALQMAVETHGWSLDRFWLPWWPSGRQFGNRAKLEPVASRSEKHLLHEVNPGVLLFRGDRPRSDAPQPLMVVLLVGETPTSGVAKEALTKSLDVVREYNIRGLGVTVGGAVLVSIAG